MKVATHGNFSSATLTQRSFIGHFKFTHLCLLNLKLYYFSTQGLNNIIHIDFDYKKEFIYWVDSTRPSGRKINRMRLNGSDLKVWQDIDGLLHHIANDLLDLLHIHKAKPVVKISNFILNDKINSNHFAQANTMLKERKPTHANDASANKQG